MNGMLIIVLIILIVIMIIWIPLLYEEINCLSQRETRYGKSFYTLEKQVSSIIRDSNSKFIMGEIGSGECCYQINKNKTLFYNQFVGQFDGFKINGNDVKLDEVLIRMEIINTNKKECLGCGRLSDDLFRNFCDSCNSLGDPYATR